MKNFVFGLAMLLGGSMAFANATNSESAKNELVTKSNVEVAEEGPGSYHCQVEDGLNSGEGHGRTMRQACRRARRALRKLQKQ